MTKDVPNLSLSVEDFNRIEQSRGGVTTEDKDVLFFDAEDAAVVKSHSTLAEGRNIGLPVIGDEVVVMLMSWRRHHFVGFLEFQDVGGQLSLAKPDVTEKLHGVSFVVAYTLFLHG